MRVVVDTIFRIWNTYRFKHPDRMLIGLSPGVIQMKLRDFHQLR